jgi:hypothetical protein
MNCRTAEDVVRVQHLSGRTVENNNNNKGKGKAIPVTGRNGP